MGLLHCAYAMNSPLGSPRQFDAAKTLGDAVDEVKNDEGPLDANEDANAIELTLIASDFKTLGDAAKFPISESEACGIPMLVCSNNAKENKCPGCSTTATNSEGDECPKAKNTQCDGKLTLADEKLWIMSKLVQTTWKMDKSKKEIKISKVESATLTLIVEYLKQRYAYSKENKEFPPEIVKPIRDTKMEKITVDFEATFINQACPDCKAWKLNDDGLKCDEEGKICQRCVYVDEQGKKRNGTLSKNDIFQIILGANYMDIKSLLYLGCAKIATLIKGKSPEEIKKILGDGEDGAVVNNLVQNAGLVDKRRLLEAMANFSK